MSREQMNIVIVGHVDHGKSTLVGRLLADTQTIPLGKIEQIREYCKRNSRPFEYAFLLDALKDEQAQGITIDVARCFFKTKKRDYIILDAPGHIEFLKNMVSGATRAEAAVLVIDAKEGVKENSKRHGYLLSMLGVNKVIVCINKMDLVDYSKERFDEITQEFSSFLKKVGVENNTFIPVSAFNGENLANNSQNLSWFEGKSLISALDNLEKEKEKIDKPFRMPVQDIYKFTKGGDDRRIIAGRVESGKIKEGDEVIFLPSNKISKIKSIESFNNPKKSFAMAGESIAITLEEQIYIKRGEVIVKLDESKPFISKYIKSNIFWMGKSNFILNKEYYLKLGTKKVQFKLQSITKILNASDLSNSQKQFVQRHEVAECILNLDEEICFDLVKEIESLGRFVIVDGYEISGGGIITDFITESDLEKKVPKTIWLTGLPCSGKTTIAKELQKQLIKKGVIVAHLDGDHLRGKLNEDLGFTEKDRIENIRRVSHVSNLFNDNGINVIASFVSPTEKIRKLASKNINNLFLVHVDCSLEECERRDVKGMYAKARKGQMKKFTGIDAPFEAPKEPNLFIDTENNSLEDCVKNILSALGF